MQKQCCPTSETENAKAVSGETSQKARSDSYVRLPDGEMCLHEMEGSGFPVARHTRVTLLPSFTMMSLEIRNIFGETERKPRGSCEGKQPNQSNPPGPR